MLALRHTISRTQVRAAGHYLWTAKNESTLCGHQLKPEEVPENHRNASVFKWIFTGRCFTKAGRDEMRWMNAAPYSGINSRPGDLYEQETTPKQLMDDMRGNRGEFGKYWNIFTATVVMLFLMIHPQWQPGNLMKGHDYRKHLHGNKNADGSTKMWFGQSG